MLRTTKQGLAPRLVNYSRTAYYSSIYHNNNNNRGNNNNNDTVLDERTLVRSLHLTNVLYVGLVGEALVKVGISYKIADRVAAHRRTFGRFDLISVIPYDRHRQVESAYLALAKAQGRLLPPSSFFDTVTINTSTRTEKDLSRRKHREIVQVPSFSGLDLGRDNTLNSNLDSMDNNNDIVDPDVKGRHNDGVKDALATVVRDLEALTLEDLRMTARCSSCRSIQVYTKHLASDVASDHQQQFKATTLIMPPVF
jgi:hypothetical protein